MFSARTSLLARTSLIAAAALAATLTLSSCAGASPAQDAADSAPSDSTAAVAFTDADVMFAQMMIPHHEQAVEMSDDLLAKDDIDPAVVALATEIKAAQEPEIAQLTDWLIEWGADEDPMSSMSGMGDGSDGMMTAEDMTALQDASGTVAESLFLQQMTEHHEGAVDMAQIEIDNGANEGARELAEAIVTTQTEEIAVMAELLAAR